MFKWPKPSNTFSIDEMAIEEVVNRIEGLNRGLRLFWSASQGWAPILAAGLLSKSRLDWQESLSGTLRTWVKAPLTQGELILAWANLGSLIEGTLKHLLSVYFEDFKGDVQALKAANAYDHKKQEAKSPDGLTLEPLRQFVKAKGLVGAEADALIDLVQKRRNAIHAFKDRPIGTAAEFQSAVRGYLKLLRAVNNRLPYPDDQYVPREV